MQTRRRILLSTALLVSFAAGLGGCAVFEGPRATNTAVATSVQESANGVAQAATQVDAVLAAYNDLVSRPATDLRPQFRTFADHVSRLESTAAQMRAAAQEMQSRGQTYFANWDVEIAQIQNENIRTRSADRKQEVAERFNELRENYLEARDRLVPFVDSLRDIHRALSNDLTPAGLESIRPLSSRVNDAADPLRESLNELTQDFREFGIALTPATAGER